MADMMAFYDQHAFWVWVAVAAAILATEVSTGTGWLLWPAASAAVVALATLVFPTLGPVATLLAFAVLTIASTLLARRFWPARPADDPDDINDNVGRLVGHHGKAVGAFVGRSGRVFIDGKEWAAELEGEGGLSPGAAVEVTGVSGGSRLRVRASP